MDNRIVAECRSAVDDYDVLAAGHDGGTAVFGGVVGSRRRPPYTWQLSGGALPSGLSLSSSGAVSGTPVAEGPFTVTITVRDSAGASVSTSINVDALGPQLLLVRESTGPDLYGKVGLGDSWTVLTTMPGKIAVAGNRIAVLTPRHVLWAKDTLDGTWYREASNITRFAIDG